jgi:hypothetical protein
MLQVGDQVRIHQNGRSIFVVAAIEDGRGLVEALGDAPGKYQFSCRLESLVLVDCGMGSQGSMHEPSVRVP